MRWFEWDKQKAEANQRKHGIQFEEMVRYREDEIPPITPERMAELEVVCNKPDSRIDLSDIPEMTDEQLASLRPFAQVVDELKAERAAKKVELETGRIPVEA